MMTMTLRVALVLVSFMTLFLMMRKIRQAKVQIESAIFWIVLALVLVVFSIFPSVADFAARMLGIYSTANFLFLFAIFLLIVQVFYMTIHISQLETKVKDLVQQMALEAVSYTHLDVYKRQGFPVLSGSSLGSCILTVRILASSVGIGLSIGSGVSGIILRLFLILDTGTGIG